MSENFQKIVRDGLVFQGAVGRQATSERKFISQYPETFMEANILCADGFSVPVAINRANWKNTKLSVPGLIEVLHDKFHQAAGYDRCTGAYYSFNG